MSERRCKKKKYFAAAVILVLILVITLGVTVVRAVFNGDEEAVHIQPSEIENSTLIIGTHLIHISALTDELYDMAMETAELSGQTDMYYKSELAGGTWYMISGAEGLSDITSQDKKVNDSVIRALYVRYHTKSDGITYDLKKGTAVCVYDTVDPYALENLPEMEAVKTQMENLEQKSKKSSTDKKNLECIQEMLEKGEKLREENKDTEKKLASLNAVYAKNAKSQETAKVLQSVMKQIDITRREKVYEKLSEEWLQDLQQEISAVEESEEENGGYVDYDLTDAVGSAMEKVEEKLTQLQGEKISETGGALAGAKSDLINKITQAAQNGQEEDIAGLVENMTDLSNIENGISANPDREAAFIQEVLLPLADNQITESTDTENMRQAFAEGEFLAKSAASKMEQTKAEEFLQERMETLDTLVESIADTNLKKQADVLKEESKNALKESLTALSSGNENEMSILLAEKEDLQTRYLAALDKNDLETASSLEKEIDAVDVEISNLEKKLTEIINSETASEAEKARALAALEGGFAASGIEEVKQTIMEDMENGQYAQAEEELEGISSFAENSPGLALTALKEIYKNAAVRLYLKGEENAEHTDNTGQNVALAENLQQAEEIIENNMAMLMPENDTAAYKKQMESLSLTVENISENIKDGIYSGMDVALEDFRDGMEQHSGAVLLALTEVKDAITSKKADITEPSEREPIDSLENTIEEMISEALEKTGVGQTEKESLLKNCAERLFEKKEDLSTAEDVVEKAESFVQEADAVLQEFETMQQGESTDLMELAEDMVFLALLEASESLEKQAAQAENGGSDTVDLESLMDSIENLTAEISLMVQQQPSGDELSEILAQILGKEFDECTEKEQAEAVLALSQYGNENGSTQAAKLAGELAEDCYNDDNPYFYEKLKNEALEFIPLDTFAKCCSYRYVFHEGNKTGILRKGTDFYEYSSFSSLVREKGGKTEEMNDYARYQSLLYLPVDYMNETFQVSAQYIPNTGYAILVRSEMEEKAAEILEAILGASADG